MYNKSIITAFACGASLLLFQLDSNAQTPTPEPTQSSTPAPSTPPSPGEEGGWHHGPGGPLEHLTRELNLTDDQKAKIKPILDQNLPQLKAIHEEAVAKAKPIMDSMAAQIRPLLTPEQQQKLDELKQRMEAGPGGPGAPGGPGKMRRGPGHEGGGPGAWLSEKLGLTPDQQAKVKAIFDASRSQVDAIRSDTSLTKDDKKAKLKAIHDSNNTQIRALLTPDQQQKFDALQAERSAKHGKPEQK